MENKESEQEKLFSDIINVKHDIQLLASFVQNDLNRLLSDKIITKNDIKDCIVEMDEFYGNLINKLTDLHTRSNILMKYYCED